jgi:hypothetical protein
MKRDQTYQVVSRAAVTVEFPNGNVVSYPSGASFQAHPTSAAIVRLLRINAIREVSAREIPNFTSVDTASASIPPTIPKKSKKSPAAGEE